MDKKELAYSKALELRRKKSARYYVSHGKSLGSLSYLDIIAADNFDGTGWTYLVVTFVDNRPWHEHVRLNGYAWEDASYVGEFRFDEKQIEMLSEHFYKVEMKG